MPRDEQLPIIVQAGNRGAGRLGLGQRREKQCREDGDDGDHHQKLNQRECFSHLRFKLGRSLWPVKQ